jgi:hypothetical protein
VFGVCDRETFETGKRKKENEEIILFGWAGAKGSLYPIGCIRCAPSVVSCCYFFLFFVCVHCATPFFFFFFDFDLLKFLVVVVVVTEQPKNCNRIRAKNCAQSHTEEEEAK